MIIWLASYPRSGNTFFRLLVKHIYGLPTYSIYQFGATSKHGLGKIIGVKTETDMLFNDMATDQGTYLMKTHNLPQDDFPAIYLVRDGRDALVSYAHYILEYAREVPKHEQPAQYIETLAGLIETDPQFGSWSDNVRAWIARSGHTVVVKFEDLIKAPIEHLHRAMEEVGYQAPNIESTPIPTFSELHKKVPDFFRKGQVGSWYEEMPAELHERFWQRHGEVMLKLGYGED